MNLLDTNYCTLNCGHMESLHHDGKCDGITTQRAHDNPDIKYDRPCDCTEFRSSFRG